ncbi:histidine phosphatase family protein, partial [Patescibacteria group bacterium]|nr:histidine phosphatase family protein [Patescibacteria group bacterium]
MGWPKLLVFVRHAESEGNVRSADERAEFDVATHAYRLTPKGERQAEITGEYMRQQFGEFDVYYRSYYRRVKSTLCHIYPDVKVYEDPRLAEASRGIWHTMTRAEIQKHMPWELVRKDREGLYHYRPPGGENWPDVELRIHSFLGTLSRDYEGQKVLIVAHGFWLILFQRLIHHLSIEETIQRYKAG